MGQHCLVLCFGLPLLVFLDSPTNRSPISSSQNNLALNQDPPCVYKYRALEWQMMIHQNSESWNKMFLFRSIRGRCPFLMGFRTAFSGLLLGTIFIPDFLALNVARSQMFIFVNNEKGSNRWNEKGSQRVILMLMA